MASSVNVSKSTYVEQMHSIYNVPSRRLNAYKGGSYGGKSYPSYDEWKSERISSYEQQEEIRTQNKIQSIKNSISSSTTDQVVLKKQGMQSTDPNAYRIISKSEALKLSNLQDYSFSSIEKYNKVVEKDLEEPSITYSSSSAAEQQAAASIEAKKEASETGTVKFSDLTAEEKAYLRGDDSSGLVYNDTKKKPLVQKNMAVEAGARSTVEQLQSGEIKVVSGEKIVAYGGELMPEDLANALQEQAKAEYKAQIKAYVKAGGTPMPYKEGDTLTKEAYVEAFNEISKSEIAQKVGLAPYSKVVDINEIMVPTLTKIADPTTGVLLPAISYVEKKTTQQNKDISSESKLESYYDSDSLKSFANAVEGFKERRTNSMNRMAASTNFIKNALSSNPINSLTSDDGILKDVPVARKLLKANFILNPLTSVFVRDSFVQDFAAATIISPFAFGEGLAMAAEGSYLVGRGLVANPSGTTEELTRAVSSEEFLNIYNPLTREGQLTYTFAAVGAALNPVRVSKPKIVSAEVGKVSRSIAADNTKFTDIMNVEGVAKVGKTEYPFSVFGAEKVNILNDISAGKIEIIGKIEQPKSSLQAIEFKGSGLSSAKEIDGIVTKSTKSKIVMGSLGKKFDISTLGEFTKYGKEIIGADISFKNNKPYMTKVLRAEKILDIKTPTETRQMFDIRSLSKEIEIEKGLKIKPNNKGIYFEEAEVLSKSKRGSIGTRRLTFKEVFGESEKTSIKPASNLLAESSVLKALDIATKPKTYPTIIPFTPLSKKGQSKIKSESVLETQQSSSRIIESQLMMQDSFLEISQDLSQKPLQKSISKSESNLIQQPMQKSMLQQIQKPSQALVSQNVATQFLSNQFSMSFPIEASVFNPTPNILPKEKKRSKKGKAKKKKTKVKQDTGFTRTLFATGLGLKKSNDKLGILTGFGGR